MYYFQKASLEGLKRANEELRKEKTKGKEEQGPGGRMMGGGGGAEIKFVTGTRLETKTQTWGDRQPHRQA